MGEIADSLIDGEFDYITGEYLGPGVGYPRSIHDKHNKFNGGSPLDRAKHGVEKFFASNKIVSREAKRKLVAYYCYNYLHFDFKQHGYDQGCLNIQMDFQRFRDFITDFKKGAIDINS